MTHVGMWVVLVAAGLFMLAGFWVLYLIKIVMNDEDLQEQLRRRRREREERRREAEDRMRQRQQEAQEMAEVQERVINEATHKNMPEDGPQNQNEAPTEA